MTAKTKTPRQSRLMREMLETAKDMHAIGVMDDATYHKTTMRDVNKAEAAMLVPLMGADIRALRERANMSQAVFAKYLNLTAGYISQLERDVRRPTGPALALLDVIGARGSRRFYERRGRFPQPAPENPLFPR